MAVPRSRSADENNITLVMVIIIVAFILCQLPATVNQVTLMLCKRVNKRVYVRIYVYVPIYVYVRIYVYLPIYEYASVCL